MKTKTQQRGMTMLGMLFTAIVVIVVGMVAIKSFSALSEYMDIKSTLNKLADESGVSEDQIRENFLKQSRVSDFVSVKPEDLQIKTSQFGGSVIQVQYRRDVPLAWNFGLYFDFDIKAGKETNN